MCMAWFPYLQLQLLLCTAQSCQTQETWDQKFNAPTPLTPQSVCFQNLICSHCLKTSSSPPRCWPLTLKIRVKSQCVSKMMFWRLIEVELKEGTLDRNCSARTCFDIYSTFLG